MCVHTHARVCVYVCICICVDVCCWWFGEGDKVTAVGRRNTSHTCWQDHKIALTHPPHVQSHSWTLSTWVLRELTCSGITSGTLCLPPSPFMTLQMFKTHAAVSSMSMSRKTGVQTGRGESNGEEESDRSMQKDPCPGTPACIGELGIPVFHAQHCPPCLPSAMVTTSLRKPVTPHSLY